MSDQHPLTIAHRGASAYLPENTLMAFRVAFERFQTDAVEFDIRLSKDKIPVVIHDATLDRTTDGHGPVCTLSAAELKQFDAGFYFDPSGRGIFPCRGQGRRIPMLEEILKTFPEKNLHIEIKDNSAETARAVADLILQNQASGRCTTGSEHAAVARELSARYPAIRRFCCAREILQLYMAYRFGFKKLEKNCQRIASLPVRHGLLHFGDPGWVRFLHRQGIKVFFWTINDPDIAKNLVRAGADGIVTDDPGIMEKTFSPPSEIGPITC